MQSNSVLFNVKIAQMLTLCEELIETFESFENLKEDENTNLFFTELSEAYTKGLEASSKDTETPRKLAEAKKARIAAWARVRRVLDGYAANALTLLSTTAQEFMTGFEEANNEVDKVAAFKSFLEGKEEKMELLSGLNETFALVLTAYEEEEALRAEIAEQSALMKDKPNATEMKKEMISIINVKILPYLRIMADLKREEFSLFFRVITKSVARANASVTPRNARKKAEIRLAKDEEVKDIGKFYDRVVKQLDADGKNFPLWDLGEYPSYSTALSAQEDGSLYVCVDEWKHGEKIVAAFVFDEKAHGKYEKGSWSLELKEGEFALIHALAVAPEAHGRKLGRKIVDFCIATAKEKGYKSIRLDVVPTNLPAKKLYESSGFQKIGDYDLELGDERLNPLTLYEYNL